MLQKRFLSFFLVLCIWLSAGGYSVELAHAAVPLQTNTFGKISPESNASITTSLLMLQWEASSEPGVRYEYCMFTKQNCPGGQWKPAGTNTFVSVNVKANTTYYWQVRARSLNNTLTYANNGTPWKFTTVPAAPSAFAKSGPANTAVDMPLSVKLTWTASTGLNVNYQVCYDTSNDGLCENNRWLSAGTMTAYTINGLDYATTYYWQVRAYNSKSTVYADGETNFRSFTTRIAPPAPFVKLIPANGAGSMPLNINLVWSPSTGTNLTYQYCLLESAPASTCENSGGVWTTVGANTFAAPAGLEYNKTYYWQVRVISNGNTAEAVQANGGMWWYFTTLLEPPASFAKILPANNASDVALTPYLYWSASEGTGIHYAYCLAEAGQVCDQWVDTGPQTFVKISTPLKNNTSYTWQVRATDIVSSEVLADSSISYSFTTLPEAPMWIVEPLTTPEDLPYANSLRATNPGSKTLLYTLAGREPAGDFKLYPDGSFTYTPEPEFNGDVTFSFTIWDGINEPTGPHTATITVTPVNDPPVITPIADVTAPIGSDIFFTVDTFDADLAYGDILTISLIGELPIGATFTPSYDPTTHAASADFEWIGATWHASHPGPYAFTLKVTDSDGAVAQDSFTIRIEPNTIFLPVLRK